MRSIAITMQGNWTLRIKRASLDGGERFAVSGAVIGNGSYEAAPGTSLFVAGAHWTLHLQRAVGLAGGAAPAWLDVPGCIGLPGVCGGLVQFEAQALHPIADDAGMVLGCSAPASEADYFVHGTASRYAGLCLFNPGRHDYLVIDSALHLHALCERHPALRGVLEKLHPDRLRHSIGPRSAAGARWTPLVLPSGLPNVANGLVFESLPRHAAEAADADPEADDTPGTVRTSVRRVAFEATTLKAGAAMLSLPDLQTLEAVREAAIRSRWSAEPAPGLPLRFMAYERSRAEQQGGPYGAAGKLTELGVAVSDARGQYLFRHHRPACDAPAAAGALQRPDLIVQVPGRSAAPLFETAPYNNITNLVRIDLLLPAAATAAASVDERAVPRLERRRAHAALGFGVGISGRRATDPANSPNPAGGHPGSGASRPRYG